MFTTAASPSQQGNQNVRRVCGNCRGTFYIRFGEENFHCPHCNVQQG